MTTSQHKNRNGMYAIVPINSVRSRHVSIAHQGAVRENKQGLPWMQRSKPPHSAYRWETVYLNGKAEKKIENTGYQVTRAQRPHTRVLEETFLPCSTTVGTCYAGPVRVALPVAIVRLSCVQRIWSLLLVGLHQHCGPGVRPHGCAVRSVVVVVIRAVVVVRSVAVVIAVVVTSRVPLRWLCRPVVVVIDLVRGVNPHAFRVVVTIIVYGSCRWGTLHPSPGAGARVVVGVGVFPVRWSIVLVVAPLGNFTPYFGAAPVRPEALPKRVR